MWIFFIVVALLLVLGKIMDFISLPWWVVLSPVYVMALVSVSVGFALWLEQLSKYVR